MLAIRNELDAYFLDRAITTFGMAVEADLDKASANAKNSKKATQARQRVLDKWLNLQPQFRDPMAGVPPKGEPRSGGVTSEQDGAVVL